MLPIVLVPLSSLLFSTNPNGPMARRGLVVAGSVQSFVAAGVLTSPAAMYPLPVLRQGDYLWYPRILELAGGMEIDLFHGGLPYRAYYDFFYSPAVGRGAPPKAPIVGKGSAPPPAPIVGKGSAPPPAPIVGGGSAPPPAPIVGGGSAPPPPAPPTTNAISQVAPYDISAGGLRPRREMKLG